MSQTTYVVRRRDTGQMYHARTLPAAVALAGSCDLEYCEERLSELDRPAQWRPVPASMIRR